MRIAAPFFSISDMTGSGGFTVSAICNGQNESQSSRLHNQGSEKARRRQRKVFVILYLTQSRSQRRARKQRRAVDPLPAGQTSDSRGSRLRQSMRADCIRYKVRRSRGRRLASRANVAKQINRRVTCVYRGSAIANSLSQVVICLLLYGYIRWKGLHRKTWGGQSVSQ